MKKKYLLGFFVFGSLVFSCSKNANLSEERQMSKNHENVRENVSNAELRACTIKHDELKNIWELRKRSLFAEKSSHESLVELLESPKSLEELNSGNLQIKHNWKSTLIQSTKGVEYVIAIWSSEKKDNDGKIIHVSEFIGSKDIEKLIDSILLNEEKNFQGGCRCGFGDGVLAFYSSLNTKSDPSVFLTLHHWQHLNWKAGWPDDGELTETSKANLKAMLKKHECMATDERIYQVN